MSGPSISPPLPYHVHTGRPCIDSVEFSVLPVVETLSAENSPIAAFRLLPVIGAEVVRSHRCITDRETVIMNLSGGGQYSWFADGRQHVVPLRRGAVRYTPAGFDCSYEFPQHSAALALSLPAGMLAASLNREDGGQLMDPLHDVADPRLTQLVRLLADETRMPGPAADLLGDGLVRAIAALLCDHAGDAEGAEASQPIRLSPARLRRVKDYIDTHLADHITLGDLAECAGLSAFHFARVFKLETGVTPYQYVSTARLSRAAMLLSQGSMPLAELALACGFSSQSHFTSAFTRAMGVSPGRFRRTAHA